MRFLVYSDTSWNWSADYVRQTCFELSRRGKVYCFVWYNTLSIKEYLLSKEKKQVIFTSRKNILVFQPLYWIPFKRFEIIRELNFYLNLVLFYFIFFLDFGFFDKSKITWIFHPNFATILPFAKCMKSKIVFDLVDNFIASIQGVQAATLIARQNKLARAATLTTANSHYLYKQLSKDVGDVLFVPQGFDVKAFSLHDNYFSHKRTMDKRPILGYVGGINYRIDYKLLKVLVKNHPEWDFWVWGPLQDLNTSNGLLEWRWLKEQSNFKTGECERKDLGKVISRFDIGLIPYNLSSEFDQYCHPMKVFEYFYYGKPVVSAPIDELKQPSYKHFVRVSKGVKEWERNIVHWLEKPLTKEDRRMQREFALSQRWENKIGMIMQKLQLINSAKEFSCSH